MNEARPAARAGERFGLVLCLVAVQGAFGCGHAATTPVGAVVKDLDLEGTHQVSKRAIEAKIATAKTGWWWPFAKKQYFDPVTWQSDLRRIERFYQSRGYYQAEVVSDEVAPVKGGVALKAVVSEGKPTCIASFEVLGLAGLTAGEQATVLDDLGLAPGNVFLEDRWDAAKEEVHDRLRELGFAEVDVKGRALVDVDAQQAALTIAVRPGPRYHFGDIDVRLGPHAQVSPAWVWEQVRLAIPEGTPFSDAALHEAQRRVFAMGLFAVAKVTAGVAEPTTARMPVVVEAREAPFRTLRAGGGVRIDQVRNEARLILEWTHRNFLGGMRRLTAHSEAGWAFIPNTYAVLRNDVAAGPRNGPIARLGLQFEQPRFLGRPSLRERSSLDLERTLEQSYDAIGGRLATGVAWQPHSSLVLFPSYNLQAYWLNGPPIASASTAPLTLGCADTGTSCFVLLSYVEEMVTWDRRDSPLEARNGFFASLSLQEGGGPLGGDFTYLRILPDVRGYLSFGRDDELTFATRLRVGELLPSGGASAVVTRFFGGGGVSMRGFSDRRLSPLLVAPAPVTSVGTAPALLTLPIGGDGLIEASLETRYQLTENLVLAVFLDLGQVTQDRIGVDDLPTLQWALGFGLRYRTPIGPIRVDFARRLQRGRPPTLFAIDPGTGVVTAQSYDVNDSCFGLGGSARTLDAARPYQNAVTDNLCAFHLAIGEAF